AVSSEGFRARCAIGNTDDYLSALKRSLSKKIIALGPPSRLTVIIPSYNSKEKFLETLLSVFSQRLSMPAEVLVFINEPPGAESSVRVVNDRNEALIGFLQDRRARPAAFSRQEFSKIITAVRKNRHLRLRCVREQFLGGLPEAYQRAIASSVARLRYFCDRHARGREEKIRLIHKYFHNTFLLILDDDTKFTSSDALANAYRYALNNNAVVLGRLRIARVSTVKKYSFILCRLMQLFLDFKHDCQLNFLTPRGISCADVVATGAITTNVPFADQLFFARAARERPRYFLDATTTIAESDHPGNGNFLRQLRQYLQGHDNAALDLFENVRARYQEKKHHGKYCAADVEKLIAALTTRNLKNIASVAAQIFAVV
ncbi:MAG: hypothetical protein KKF80_00505, partial [Candidatus Omnitrophica bacterium]|nr:hypothetical protein [Candidatus Omnitrophota bacterium]